MTNNWGWAGRSELYFVYSIAIINVVLQNHPMEEGNCLHVKFKNVVTIH